MNDFIIFGGGNSGYISALILKSRFPEKRIQIIESEKIGIVGVGEGSTEHWKNFLNFCNINPLKMIKECGSTFKMGIYYKNWKKYDYFHVVSNDYNSTYDDYFYKYGYLISENKNPLELLNSWFLENKFPNSYLNSGFPPINQFHFDTNKLNDFLKKTCLVRGVIISNDTIIGTKVKSNTGEIISLKSKNTEYFSKFFIDCTGFRSELMKKTLNVEWISYDKYFPLNSALAFPTEKQEVYDCYTTAQTRKSGWSWKIPTQDRTGNGYVFSDSFISEDQAYDEIVEEYGEVEIAKRIKFNPGRLEKFWYKNCLGVGLSSNFIEPLEATSIASVIQQMFCFISYYPSGDDSRFNTIMNGVFDNIVDYVLLHYLADRDDTPFWKHCKNDLVLTETLKEHIINFKYRLPQINDFTTPWKIFGAQNYIIALHGLGLFDRDRIKTEYELFLDQYKKSKVKNDYEQLKHYEKNCDRITHNQLINLLKEL